LAVDNIKHKLEEGGVKKGIRRTYGEGSGNGEQNDLLSLPLVGREVNGCEFLVLPNCGEVCEREKFTHEDHRRANVRNKSSEIVSSP
jgi:hypothetical protein